MAFLKDPNTCLHRIRLEYYEILASIFEMGILSRKLLKKHKIPFKNGFAVGAKVPENCVSVTTVIQKERENPEKYLLEVMNDCSLLTLIIRGDIKILKQRDIGSDESSKYVLEKIPPKYIIGVAICDKLLENYYDKSYPEKIIRHLKDITKKYGVPFYEVNASRIEKIQY